MANLAANSRIKLRRSSDRTRWLLLYCVIGLLSMIARSALAADDTVCVATMKEMRLIDSPKLKKLASQILAASDGFNNKTKTSHLAFTYPEGPDGPVVFELHSTTNTDNPSDPGQYELADGAAKICETSGGKLSLESKTLGSVDLSTPDDCFRIHKAFISAERLTFCPGKMPSHISSAREKAGGIGLAIRGIGGSSRERTIAR